MGDYGGFIHIIRDPRRSEQIADRLQYADRFTDAISAPDCRPKEREFFLVSLGGGDLHYAALAKKSGRVATGLERIEFSCLVELNNVPIAKIKSGLDARSKRYFTSAIEQECRVPPKTWRSVIRRIKNLAPECSRELDQIAGMCDVVGRLPSRRGFSIVAEEKDATALALDLSGFARKTMLGALRETDIRRPRSLFANLPSQSLREEVMIAHDHSVFGDLRKTDGFVGEHIFSGNGFHLSVINTNRTPIEETIGVDLLYYNHDMRSFVGVQYKRMLREPGIDEEGQIKEVFYRPDDQCQAEVNRMVRFLKAHSDVWNGNPLSGYRLNPVCFFFKLCPSVVYQPYDTSLLKGMYIPLDYWLWITKSREITGPRGGIRLTYKNIPNRINNSAFIDLVANGLVGSRGCSSGAIQSLLSEALQSRKSIVAAELYRDKTSHTISSQIRHRQHIPRE